MFIFIYEVLLCQNVLAVEYLVSELTLGCFISEHNKLSRSTFGNSPAFPLVEADASSASVASAVS